MRNFRSLVSARSRRLHADQSGVSAVEFALLAPVFCLILAGTLDFGGALYARFGLNAAVAAGSNYTIVNAAKVNATDGAALASSVASLVASSQSVSWANATVVVNNGATGSMEGATFTQGGTASNADRCYCPTVSDGAYAWGSGVTCGGGCPGGGLAGKYVTILAKRSFTPVLQGYGFAEDGEIRVEATVRVQ